MPPLPRRYRLHADGQFLIRSAPRTSQASTQPSFSTPPVPARSSTAPYKLSPDSSERLHPRAPARPPSPIRFQPRPVVAARSAQPPSENERIEDSAAAATPPRTLSRHRRADFAAPESFPIHRAGLLDREQVLPRARSPIKLRRKNAD